MQLEKIYSIWRREMTRFIRERSRLVTSVVSPLLWVLIFGSGMRGASFGAQAGGGADYRAFIFPGILGMTLLFSGMFSGISVIWDRQFGILKAALVAPVSRGAIVTGKALGGATASMIQGSMLLAFAPLAGVHLSAMKVIAVLPVMLFVSMGIVGLGLLIAAFMESMEGFNLIMSFAIMPMFFFSGALYPLDTASAWLRIASWFDPLTYGVDALRAILLESRTGMLPLAADVAVIAGFAAAGILLSSAAFSRRK